MTKHTSSCIIYDDTWSSLYCHFDRKESLWLVRIRIDSKYYLGKGLSLNAAVGQVQEKITAGDFQLDLAAFGRGDNKPVSSKTPTQKLEDLF